MATISSIATGTIKAVANIDADVDADADASTDANTVVDTVANTFAFTDSSAAVATKLFAVGSAAKSSMRDGAVAATSSARDKVSDMMGGGKELSWEDLCNIEKRRRAILKRTELPFFRILLFWDGTVLKLLAHDFLMWITMLIYVLVRIGARVGMPDFVSDLGGADIGIIGGFLSFFLVFFVVASNKRFDTLYGTSMSCEGRIFDAAALARTTLPRERALRLIRYMNAVHISGYVGLSDAYSFDNFFLEINETNCLLTDKELERIKCVNMDMGGSAYRELIVWCCAEVSDALKIGLIDSRLASQYRDLILRLRGSLGALYDYDDQPVSFFYVHFVCLLSVMYLPLFAVSAGLAAGTGADAYWLNDIIQGLIVFLQAVFVIGLRLLAIKMSDPYGSDVEDLSVMHYQNFTWRMSSRMLNARPPEQQANLTQEEELRSEAQGLSEAWEPSTAEKDFLAETASESKDS